MRNWFPAPSLIALLLLAACSSATQYQSDFFGHWTPGGYDETAKGDDLWHVSFSANAMTTRETVQTYWLYRCATLTLEKGYDGFEIVSRLKLTAIRPSRSAEIKFAASSSVPIFVPIGPGADSGMVHNIGADIRLLHKPFEPSPPKRFDAAALKATLDPIVNAAKCENDNICPHAHDYLGGVQ